MTLTAPIPTRTLSSPTEPATGRPGTWLGWLLGLAAFGVSVSGSWIPSLWGDEAASVLSAERPLPSLFRMLGHVDAVHGTYYFALHFWIDVFGASAFSVRFPSAIAAGLAAAGIFFLVRDLGSRRLAFVAALVFALLPRTVSFGDEARSYATGAAIATWLLFLFVRLVTRRTLGARWWILYGLVLAAGIYTFLYFGLFIAVHAVVLAQTRTPRAVLKRWAIAVAAALVAAAPVIYWSLSEHGQVAFLAGRDTVTPTSILVTTWFGDLPFAITSWSFIGVAVLFLVVDLIRDRRILMAAHESAPARPVSLTVLALAWFLVPLAFLVVGNFVVADFSPRYLSYSAPAAGILIAVGIVRLARLVSRRSRVRAIVATTAGTALVLGLATPIYLQLRTPYAKNESDWKEISEVMAAHAKPGDAVVFDDSTRPSRRTRLAESMYPSGFAGLRDVTLDEPAAKTDSWHDSVYTVPQAMSLGRFTGVDRVWVIEYAISGKADTYGLSSLESAGYKVVTTYSQHRSEILELSK